MMIIIMIMIMVRLLVLFAEQLLNLLLILCYECPVTTTARAQMYDVLKASVNGESKLQQCLNLSCDNKRVARFVSCGLWNGKHALVSKAIAMFLQKAWGIRNAYKHGTPVVDVFESASERRGADGIDARA
jgi:CelD/BcsL family acetyltransferase involved in cellulose biosynthesis